ncbi:FMN-binding negative transcriptional regulator [Qipengyuania sp. DY56-A-20]|jgi:transcriptional regulator|uniref:FMN-binding negative transcriptional regulator n=1 Tax=Qipengyuania benthica TaxID=3067651 RepID=A0ABT9H675_9SPHN|nr:FMN-binding negative transcriptional regulator [Qipengyuania sp. DY56-A-20]MDP4538819.1 FMN-binding negative transcriptional regulator [Qipengyuania sp. DY56-A-20]
MHPNPQFRCEDRQLLETLIEQIGFGMVFLTTPDGPRVAHTPLLSTGTGQVRFHLARGNALTGHLEGATALVTVNGPDAYVSPRWYDNRDTVPTWDYVAIEMEGRVRRLTDEELEEFLHAAIARHEARIEGAQWQAGESSEATWSKLFGAIVGFELDVQKWRPTLKLSQKKSVAERARIAEGHTAAGRPAIAAHMRTIGA